MAGLFESIRNWFGSSRGTSSEREAIQNWCSKRQLQARFAADKAMVSIEGRRAVVPWKLEWGLSQRPYIGGPELRLRADMELPLDLHILVLNRELQESIEASVFAQYVEDVQTRLDMQTPPEMRWLVLFPRMGAEDLQGLHKRFAAVTSHKPWLMAWLDGNLAAALSAAPRAAEDPMVLTIARGRMVLRLAMPALTAAALETWVSAFETAIDEAGRVMIESGDDPTPSTQPGMWTSLDDDFDPPPDKAGAGA